MLRKLADGAIVRACGLAPRVLGNFNVLPVLHVERLHDDTALRNVLEFCRNYIDASGCKPVATVIPPISPILARELAGLSFDRDAYAQRIARLKEVADIGLHGHYLRDDRFDAPVHHYWSEQAVVRNQMEDEIAWLEERSLMERRVYSAGWWFLDPMLRHLLGTLDFEFEVSISGSRFNQGPLSFGDTRHRAGNDAVGRRPGTPSTIRALCRICATSTRSHVPRQLLRALLAQRMKHGEVTVSLYNHDWDMDPAAARITIRDLARVGARLVGLPPRHATART
jgi:hypothetical protein